MIVCMSEMVGGTMKDIFIIIMRNSLPVILVNSYLSYL